MTKKELLELLKDVPDHAEIIRPEFSHVTKVFDTFTGISKINVTQHNMWHVKGKYILGESQEAFLLY